MNNPTLCESLIEGKRCNELSSYIYKSAFATRFICDSCARQYRHEGSEVPLLEFALLELLPARHVLVDRLDRVTKAYEKLKAVSARGIHFSFFGCTVTIATTRRLEEVHKQFGYPELGL